MFILYTILIAALAATLYFRAQKPAPQWNALLVAEALAAIFLALWNVGPVDVAKPYQAVFRASGYGLGQLMANDSAGVSDKVLVLLPSDAEVDQWRVEGLRKALSGSKLSIGETVVLTTDLQTGDFSSGELEQVLSSHSSATHVVAFAGLGKRPATATWSSIYVFHPFGVDGMADWWKSGQLKAVAAPSGTAPPPPAKNDSLKQVFGIHFIVRTEP